MAQKQILLTNDGLKALEAELEYLTKVRRQEVSEKIKVALGFGDLSENSEYDEAKNEQAQVESRIVEVEAMLNNYEIIDESRVSTDAINIGSKVKVLDEEYDEVCDYQIVGSTEANPLKGCISDESPVGKELLGHKVGDVVTVETPAGNDVIEILEIFKP